MFSLVLSRGQKHFSEQFKTVDIQKSNSNTDLKISLRDLRGYFFLMMILPTGRILLILQCDYLPHYGSLNSYCFLNGKNVNACINSDVKNELTDILLFAVVPVHVLLKFCHIRNMDSTIKKKKRNIERKIEMHYCLCRNTLLNSPWSFQLNLKFLLGVHTQQPDFPHRISIFCPWGRSFVRRYATWKYVWCSERRYCTLVLFYYRLSPLQNKQACWSLELSLSPQDVLEVCPSYLRSMVAIKDSAPLLSVGETISLISYMPKQISF